MTSSNRVTGLADSDDIVVFNIHGQCNLLWPFWNLCVLCSNVVEQVHPGWFSAIAFLMNCSVGWLVLVITSGMSFSKCICLSSLLVSFSILLLFSSTKVYAVCGCITASLSSLVSWSMQVSLSFSVTLSITSSAHSWPCCSWCSMPHWLIPPYTRCDFHPCLVMLWPDQQTKRCNSHRFLTGVERSLSEEQSQWYKLSEPCEILQYGAAEGAEMQPGWLLLRTVNHVKKLPRGKFVSTITFSMAKI